MTGRGRGRKGELKTGTEENRRDVCDADMHRL